MKIEVGYLIKPKKKLTGVLQDSCVSQCYILVISKTKKYSIVPQQTFDFEQFMVFDFKIGKYYYIISCIDIKDKKRYCFLIDLEIELKDIFSVLSEDIELNKVKYQIVTGKPLYLGKVVNYGQLMEQRDNRIQAAKDSIKSFNDIPLFYIGDKVELNRSWYLIEVPQYRISTMSRAVISGTTEIIWLQPLDKKETLISSIYHLNLVERVKNPSLLFNSRYINNKNIVTYEVEKG